MQRQQVVEVTHDRFDLGLVAPTHRRTDDQLMLACRARQHGVIQREQGHVERGIGLLRHVVHRIGIFARNADPLGAAKAGHARTARVVGRQCTHVAHLGQAFAPEAEL